MLSHGFFSCMTLVFVFCFVFVLRNPRTHLLSALLHSKPKVAQLSYWVIQWKELLRQQMGWWLNKPLGTPPQPLQRCEVISSPLKITEPISTSFSSIPFSHIFPPPPCTHQWMQGARTEMGQRASQGCCEPLTKTLSSHLLREEKPQKTVVERKGDCVPQAPSWKQNGSSSAWCQYLFNHWLGVITKWNQLLCSITVNLHTF